MNWFVKVKKSAPAEGAENVKQIFQECRLDAALFTVGFVSSTGGGAVNRFSGNSLSRPVHQSSTSASMQKDVHF